MAATITVAILQTLLQTKDDTFSSGLQGATRKAAGWAADIGKTVATVGLAVVAAGAAAAAAGVLGLGAAITKMTIDAAPLEGIGIAFDKMSARVGLSLQDLQAAAGGTISDFELMRQANVALTGAADEVGVALGENLPKLLEIARAASKATGESVDFLFGSLVTGVKRSSPLMIDNTGLVLKVSEANQAMADSLGIAVDELSAEEKQIALLNATVLAGQTMVEEFGGGQITAAEQLAQFKASIQNTKDAIGIGFLPALQALMEPIQSISGDVGPKLVEWAQIAGTWLGEKLPDFIEKTQMAFGDVLFAIEAFTSLSPGDFPWEDILPPALAEIAYEIADAFEQFVAVLESGQGVFAAAVEVFDDFLPEETINRIWDLHDAALALSGEALAAVTDFWNDELIPAFEDAEKFIKANLTPIIGGLKGAFVGLAVALAGGAIAALVSGIGSAIAAIATPVMALIALGALIGAAWAGNWGGIRDIVHSAIFETIIPAVEAVKTWFEANWPIIQAIALTAWTVIRDIALSVADVILNQVWPQIQEAFDNISTALEMLGIDWDTLKIVVGIVLAALGAVILAAVGIIVSLINGIAAAVVNLTDVWRSQVENIILIVEGFKLWWLGVTNVIMGILTLDFPRALEGFRQAFEGIFTTVEAIVNSIWDVIRMTFGTVLAFIGGFVDGIVGFFQGLWDRLTGGSIIPEMMAEIQSVITTALDFISGLWETFKDNVIAFTETLKSDLAAIWKNIKSTAVETWAELRTEVEVAVSDVVNEIISMFEQALETVLSFVDDFVQAGQDLLDGLIEGIIIKAVALFHRIREVIRGALDIVRDVLDSESASRVMFQEGVNFVDGLIEGIESRGGAFVDVIKNLFDIAKVFGSLGSAAARQFRDQMIDPLKELLGLRTEAAKASKNRIESLRDQKAQMVEQLTLLNQGEGIFRSEEERLQKIADLRAAMLANDRLFNLEQIRRAGLVADVDRITGKILEKEEALVALAEQKQMLSFLQEQADLINLIETHGLDANEVLGDLVGDFGVGADPTAVLEAMTRALEEMVERASREIQNFVNPDLPILPPADVLPLPPEGPLRNQFILFVNTMSSREDLMQDFALLQAMA